MICSAASACRRNGIRATEPEGNILELQSWRWIAPTSEIDWANLLCYPECANEESCHKVPDNDKTTGQSRQENNQRL
jgi:hypothetical protein